MRKCEKQLGVASGAQGQLERSGVAELFGGGVVNAARRLKSVANDRVDAVGPQSVLRGAAGADGGKRRQRRRAMMIRPVPVAVQPQADAAALRHSDEIVQISQAVRAPLRLAAFQADGIMRNQDAPSSRQPGE